MTPSTTPSGRRHEDKMESHANVNGCQGCNFQVVDAEANAKLAKMKAAAIKIREALAVELKVQAAAVPAFDQMAALLAKFRDEVKILNTTNEQATLLSCNSSLFENAPEEDGKVPINVCKCQICVNNPEIKKSEKIAEFLTHNADYLSAVEKLIKTTVLQIEKIAQTIKAGANDSYSEIDPGLDFDLQAAFDDYEKFLEEREAAVAQREAVIEATFAQNLERGVSKVHKVSQLPKELLKKIEVQKEKAEKLESIEKRLDDETSEKNMKQKTIKEIEDSSEKVANKIGKYTGKSPAEARNELKISKRILEIISIGLKNENKNPPNIDFVQGQLLPLPESQLCAAYPDSAVLDFKAVLGELIFFLRREVSSSNQE